VCDRKARERNFKAKEIINLFSPPKKPKFWTPWAGPYKFVARLSTLNYRIMNLQGKEFVVQVDRVKRAYNLGI
jgi:hypothetical protein